MAIVGAGLAGTIAAVQLGRRGLTSALIDLHAHPRPEFRAEQLVGPQVNRLEELGLLARMTEGSRLSTEALNGRLGQVVDRTCVSQFGVPYEAMVRGCRAAVPETVAFVPGRVAVLDNGPLLQRLMLSSGVEIEARLVVLATGLSSVLPKRLGIESRVVRAGHSLALGFDVRIEGATANGFKPLTYYGENTRDRVDYLALFAMHGTIRANLFCYWDQNSDWVRAFCKDPKQRLLAAMPQLTDLTGGLDVTSAVQARSNDLRVAEDPARDGVVLVGDAFQTPCPAAGTGIDRLLSDLDILCGTHVPAWFATPGMDRDKMAAYYADPAKQAFDAECLRIAEYRRAVTTEQTLRWAIHRQRVFLSRRLQALVERARRAEAA